jgi:hypothetical protein
VALVAVAVLAAVAAVQQLHALLLVLHAYQQLL